MSTNRFILTINAGSSSIKLALFDPTDTVQPVYSVEISDIGQPEAYVSSSDSEVISAVTAADHATAAKILAEQLSKSAGGKQVTLVGHRIVHGGPSYVLPQLIDSQLIEGLRQLIPFDPEHLPIEIQLIEMFRTLFPNCQQVACFDTAFHHDLPAVARLLPIPLEYAEQGIRRYGFHGLSYSSVLAQLHRLDAEAATSGRIIVAHLGSGVSLAAIKDGKSIDTTMALTPASGVPMSTRSGDIDPGLVVYLARSESLSPDQFSDLFNFKSGLLGLSQTSADMKQLLHVETDDSRAKNAIDLFCYQVRKSIGSLTAALGGLDQLIFTGGMGEQSSPVRARICAELDFLGILLDDELNSSNAAIISANGSTVPVRIIHANEASTIATNIQDLIQKGELS